MANSSPRRNGALRGGAVLALSWAFAAVAGAQPMSAAADNAQNSDRAEEQRPSSDVVVTGRRPASAAEVGRFVGAVLSETGSDHVARWADRIFLGVEGVGEAHRDYFVGEIAAVGRELNLQIAAHRHCEPSATIVFTGDPSALLARLESDRPAFFGAVPRAERAALAAATAPVRWLAWAQYRGANGETPLSFYVDPKSGGVERPVPAMRTQPSRLQAGSRMDLQSMFVVVDTSKLRGVSNGALAAYLAMVVFGNVRPPHGETGAASILGLFDESRPAGEVEITGLTLWDLSYLRSLYAGNWNMAADRRRSVIEASMARELGAGR